MPSLPWARTIDHHKSISYAETEVTATVPFTVDRHPGGIELGRPCGGARGPHALAHQAREFGVVGASCLGGRKACVCQEFGQAQHRKELIPVRLIDQHDAQPTVLGFVNAMARGIAHLVAADARTFEAPAVRRRHGIAGVE